MANHNHLLSVTCYNVTMQKQDYYNEFFELGQQKINFSFHVETVCLLSKLQSTQHIEIELDLTDMKKASYQEI